MTTPLTTPLTLRLSNEVDAAVECSVASTADLVPALRTAYETYCTLARVVSETAPAFREGRFARDNAAEAPQFSLTLHVRGTSRRDDDWTVPLVDGRYCTVAISPTRLDQWSWEQAEAVFSACGDAREHGRQLRGLVNRTVTEVFPPTELRDSDRGQS